MIPVLPLLFACSSQNRPLRVPAYPDAVTGAPITAYRKTISHIEIPSRSSVPLRNHLQLLCLHPSQLPGILCKRRMRLTLFFVAFAYEKSVTQDNSFVKLYSREAASLSIISVKNGCRVSRVDGTFGSITFDRSFFTGSAFLFPEAIITSFFARMILRGPIVM